MTTLLLCLLFAAPVVAVPIVLARRRGGLLGQRAIALAAAGGLDLDDVVAYTRDCSRAACLLIAHRHGANPASVRRYLADAVAQVDCVQRAARVRRALGRRWRAGRSRLPVWPDVLLFLTGLLDADVLARLIQWRGDAGIADLEAMTDRALADFTAAMRQADEAPFVTLFADELVRLGLLDASVLDDDADMQAERSVNEK
jgi:hypothetical protein